MTDLLPITPNITLADFEFLPVPAGTALLGMEQKVAERFINSYGPYWDQFFGREIPQHEVEISAFELARYPVTNGLYAQFMAAGGYDSPTYWTPDGWAWRIRTNRQQPRYWGDARFMGDSKPVVGVSWYEAMAFAAWAAAVTGRPVRLPTEAEWEWAARGPNAKWLYPWGGVWDATKLNSGYHDDKHTPHRQPVPVGSYSPAGDAPFGHADMLGQVWEWTNSLFAPYPYTPADGREDRYTPEKRVLRGGNWADGKYVNRLTARYLWMPFYADTTTGFRLAVGGDSPALARRPKYDLVVVGRSVFCPDLIDVKHWLHAWNVPYRQINHDLVEEMAWRLDSWLGSRTVPTLFITEYGQIDPISEPTAANLQALRNTDRGSMLHEPDEGTLRAFLARYGMTD
jgi:formylglycine-generating enzyme required for sulfatase activity/glutaredoxin